MATGAVPATDRAAARLKVARSSFGRWNRETRRATRVNGKPVARLQSGALEQIVGRERNQRACLRHLVRNAVVARRVNSTVRAHRSSEN